MLFSLGCRRSPELSTKDNLIPYLSTVVVLNSDKFDLEQICYKLYTNIKARRIIRGVYDQRSCMSRPFDLNKF